MMKICLGFSYSFGLTPLRITPLSAILAKYLQCSYVCIMFNEVAKKPTRLQVGHLKPGYSKGPFHFFMASELSCRARQSGSLVDLCLRGSDKFGTVGFVRWKE